MRESNEDIEKYCLNLSVNGKAIDPNYAPIDLFVICDGHGGKLVAEYVVSRLEKFFMKKNLIYPLSHNYICQIYDNIQQELIEHPYQIARMSGCTALVVVRYLDKHGKENVQVINVGDCRAVLSRKGLAFPLNKDHKPLWPDEKSRIDMVNKEHGTNWKIHYEAGDWRIGDLSVSRSFGDLDNVPFVCHTPDIFHYRLQMDDEFIIIACDGLWDVLQNHEAVNFVRDHVNNNHIEYYNIPNKYPSIETASTNNIARKLASYAIARNSMDNVSIFIIFFVKNLDNINNVKYFTV
jgi:protein phosphatase 2C